MQSSAIQKPAVSMAQPSAFQANASREPPSAPPAGAGQSQAAASSFAFTPVSSAGVKRPTAAVAAPSASTAPATADVATPAVKPLPTQMLTPVKRE